MISVDRFSVLRAPLLAPDVRDVVSRNREWLHEYKPTVADAYNDYWPSVKRIGRIARDPNLNAYVIRRDRVAIGIASVITNQAIQVENYGGTVDLRGRDFDYWTDDPASLELSEFDEWEFLSKLIIAENVQAGEQLFAVMNPDEVRRAPGLTMHLHKYGFVDTVVAAQPDRYGILPTNEQNLSVYTNT